MTIEVTNPSIPPAAPSPPKTFTRVKVLESGPAKAKEVIDQKQSVRIKDSVSNKEAKTHGYDDELIELVLQGLNTDASKRPPAARFQEYFASKKS